MALTAAEVVATRRYTGYGVNSPEPVAAAVAALSTDEEAALRTAFLAPLLLFETAITASSDSLDTASAAVWTRNAAELAERSTLYRSQRLALCRFLGIAPGPGIYDPIVVVTDPGGDTGTGGLSVIPDVLVV